MNNQKDVIILGVGITGLGAGLTSGYPIYEANNCPGGLCTSYYREGYRFELSGGKWIFGVTPTLKRFLSSFGTLQEYTRSASVYFSRYNIYIPYPIQNHLWKLGTNLAKECLIELMAVSYDKPDTMLEWLYQNFGDILTRLFFKPFNKRYTADLCRWIAPQDNHKSPLDIPLIIQGAFEDTKAVGYNINFMYPKEGLAVLINRMAEKCQIHYNKRAFKIDIDTKEVFFEDGTSEHYETLLSTLPLDKMLEMTHLQVESKPDPYTSVLVVNIGAERGPNCPDDHWLYIPDSVSGFHRVGFYSNVDKSFLPPGSKNKVSLYVEKAYKAGQKPSPSEIGEYVQKTVKELIEWGFVGNVEVISSHWIETAYTWKWPESTWKQEAIDTLETHDIIQMGRYGRWQFQGIAESLREGLLGGIAI